MADQPALIRLGISNDPPPAKKIGAGISAGPSGVGGSPVKTRFDGANQTLRLDMRVFSPFDGMVWNGDVQLDEGFFFEGQNRTFRELVFDGPNSPGSGGGTPGVRITGQFGQFGRVTSFVNHSFLIWAFTVVETDDTLLLKFIPDTEGETYTWVPEGEQLAEYTAWLDRATEGKGHFTLVQVDAKFYNLPPTPMRETVWSAGMPFDGKLRNIPPKLTEGGLASDVGSSLDGALQEIPPEIAQGGLASGGASVGAPLSPIPNKDSQAGLAAGGAAAADVSVIDRIFPGTAETQVDAIAANSALDVQADGIKPITKASDVGTAAGGAAFDGALQEIDPEPAEVASVTHGAALDGALRKIPTQPSTVGAATHGASLGASPVIIPVPKIGAGLASTGAAQTGEPSKTMLSDKGAASGTGSSGAALDGEPVKIHPGTDQAQGGLTAGGAAFDGLLRGIRPGGKPAEAGTATAQSAADGELRQLPVKGTSAGIASHGPSVDGGLRKVPPLPIFDFETTVINNRADRYSQIGYNDDRDDILVPSEYLRDTDNVAFLNQLRVRSNALRFDFRGDAGRFSVDVENDSLFVIESPIGTVLAVINGISSFWVRSTNRYLINDDAAFLSGDRASLNATIRANGIGENVRLSIVDIPPAQLREVLPQTGAALGGTPETVKPETGQTAAGIAAQGASANGQLRKLPTELAASGIASSAGSGLDAGLRKLPEKLIGAGIGTAGASLDGKPDKTRIRDELSQVGISSHGAALDARPVSIPPGGAVVEAQTASGGASLGAGLRKLPVKTSLVVAASSGPATDGALQETPTKLAGVGVASSPAALDGALGVLDPKTTQAGAASWGASADAAPEVDAAGTKPIGADLRSSGAAADGAPNRIRSLFRPAGVGLATVGSALGGLLRKLPLKFGEVGASSSGAAVSAGLTQIPQKDTQAGTASGAGAVADAGAEKIPVPPEWEFIVSNVSARSNSFSTIGQTGTDDDQPVPRGFLTPTSPQGAVINFLRIRGTQFQIRFRLDDTRFAEFVENDYFLEIADEDDNIIALLWMYGSTWGEDRYRINDDRFFFAGSLDAINTFVRDNGVGTVVRMRIYEPPTALLGGSTVSGNVGYLDGGLVNVPFKSMAAGHGADPAALDGTPTVPPLPAIGAGIASGGAGLRGRAAVDPVMDERAAVGLSAAPSLVNGLLRGIKPGLKFLSTGISTHGASIGAAIRKLLPKLTKTDLASSGAILGGHLAKLGAKITRSGAASSGSALDGAPGKTTVGDKDGEVGLVSGGASVDAQPRKIRTEDQSSSGFAASAGAALDGGLAKIPTKKTAALSPSTGAAADPHLMTVGVETDGQMRSEMLSTGASASGGLRKLPPVRSYVAMATAGAALDGALRKLLTRLASAPMFAGNAVLQEFAERNTPAVKEIGCGMSAGSGMILQSTPSEVNIPMALPYTLQLDQVLTLTPGPNGFAQWRGTIPAERTTADNAVTLQFQLFANGQNRPVGASITFVVEGSQIDLNDELLGALLQIRSPDGNTVFWESIIEEDWNVSTGSYTVGVPYTEAQAIYNGGTTGLQLHFTNPDTRIFNFLITDVGATPAAWTIIGDTSDDDDQRVERALALNGAQATIGHMRCRSTQFQIIFADGRLSPAVESQWALDIESPNGTQLALISGDLGRYWSANNTRYNFTADDVFLGTTRSAFNTAIRARGEGANVRMTLREPFYAEGETFHLTGGAALGGGVRKLLHKMASAGLSSDAGSAADAAAGTVKAAIKDIGAGSASGGAVFNVLGMRFQIPFFVGAQAVARGAALAAGVRKVPVGPPKPVGSGVASSGTGVGAGLRKLLGKVAGGTLFGSGAALGGGLETFKDDAEAGIAASGGGVVDSRPAKIQPVLDGPTDLFVTSRGRDFVAIQWTAPDDFGLPILGYQYSLDNGAWTSTGSPETQARVEGLDIDTSYTVAVRGVNTAGPGAASDSINVRTVMASRPTAPRDLSISATGGRSLDLRWDTPADDGGLPIQRYQVCVIDETGVATPFEDTDDESLTWRIRGLAFGHRYGFRIRAIAGGGVGDSSDIVYGIPETNRPPLVRRGVEIPMLDEDRQSLILRLDDQDCLLTVWWQPSDQSWWGSLEAPVNEPAVQGRRLALNAGLLDRISDILPGNIVMRAAGGSGDEPGRNAWREKTHTLRWEPDES